MPFTIRHQHFLLFVYYLISLIYIQYIVWVLFLFAASKLDIWHSDIQMEYKSIPLMFTCTNSLILSVCYMYMYIAVQQILHSLLAFQFY